MEDLSRCEAVRWRSFESRAPSADQAGGRRLHAFNYTSGTGIWYKPGEVPVHVRWVLVCDPAKAPGEEGYLELLVSSDPGLAAEDIIRYYLMRWSCEVTFTEVRRHLGVETQRQWSDRAIARTSPCVMALFSISCLLAHHANLEVVAARTAWYRKRPITFSDVLPATRQRGWAEWIYKPRPQERDVDKSEALLRQLTDKVRYLQHALVRCAA